MIDLVSQEKRREIMSRVPSKNTKPELAVRKLIFSLGYRYRLHPKNLRGRPDLVFPGRRKVIFVHGCFWHGHQNCNKAKLPATNTDYWRQKIADNIARDRNINNELTHLGWSIMTVWQCELKHPEELTSKLQIFLNT